MKNKSVKDRVRKYGEVKTQHNEVKNMLKLVSNEIERVDSRFLEPACGDGNFLTEILLKKLNIAYKKSKKNLLNFEIQTIYGLSSLYGIELLEDNVEIAKNRLKQLIINFFIEKFNVFLNDEYSKSINLILNLNIIQGDALSLKTISKSKKEIIFSEWTMVNETDFNRRDYIFRDLMEYQPFNESNLFSDLGDQAFVPKPIKEHGIKNYLKIYEYSNK